MFIKIRSWGVIIEFESWSLKNEQFLFYSSIAGVSLKIITLTIIRLKSDWPLIPISCENPSNCAYESAENPNRLIKKDCLFIIGYLSNLLQYIKTSGTFIVKNRN
jgi:hypothetical protein